MASEEGVPAAKVVFAEEVAVRTKSLVQSLLRSGGPLGVEAAADAAADGARRVIAEMSQEHFTVCREDVESLAVAAAEGALATLVHGYEGSLNLPQGVVEAARQLWLPVPRWETRLSLGPTTTLSDTSLLFSPWWRLCF